MWAKPRVAHAAACEITLSQWQPSSGLLMQGFHWVGESIPMDEGNSNEVHLLRFGEPPEGGHCCGKDRRIGRSPPPQPTVRATDGLCLLGYVPVRCWTYSHPIPPPFRPVVGGWVAAEPAGTQWMTDICLALELAARNGCFSRCLLSLPPTSDGCRPPLLQPMPGMAVHCMGCCDTTGFSYAVQAAEAGPLELMRRFINANKDPNPTPTYNRMKIITGYPDNPRTCNALLCDTHPLCHRHLFACCALPALPPS